jgi:hypothetical protein
LLFWFTWELGRALTVISSLESCERCSGTHTVLRGTKPITDVIDQREYGVGVGSTSNTSHLSNPTARKSESGDPICQGGPRDWLADKTKMGCASASRQSCIQTGHST